MHEDTWTCPGCGEAHRGLFDLACDRPDHWPGGAKPAANAALDKSGDFLSEDFCVLDGTHYFVRCVLMLPVQGADGSFGYGVWSTLSEANFDAYVESFDGGEQGRLGPWFGWFSNALKGYPDTLNLKCRIHPHDGSRRPSIELEPTEHPLAVAQRDGISFDKILDLYALNGHDIRPALSD
ncbi:MAG: DUF2199 domain-containing protein [Alphaproteobacteria bacterium]|nr:DUF2199 domain-containing protein [Alphaproteobacteria bacterium]